MTREKYVKEIVKRLRCSGTKKQEIRRQLESDIAAALEGGEEISDVMGRMGTPPDMAKEFNDNFPPEELKAAGRIRKLKMAAVIAAAVVLVLAVIAGMVLWMLPKSSMDMEHFNEEEAKAQVERIIDLLDADDYEGLREISVEEMKTDAVEEQLIAVKAMFGSDWGARQSLGKMYFGEITQMGQTVLAVQVNVGYENANVTYTIVLDENLQLGGLYMK